MSKFLEGVEEKYPKYLLDKRVEAEGNVIACLFSDPGILEENEIPDGYFITKDGRFYYEIIKKLREKNIFAVDEVSIMTTLPEGMVSRFNAIGGYRTINHLQKIINLENWSAYYEEFVKKNLLNKLYLDGFNLEKTIKIQGKEVRPMDLFDKMTSNEILDFYDTQLSSYAIGDQSLILEEGNLCFGKEWMEKLESGEAVVEQGTPYNCMGEDEFEMPVNTFNYLNDRTLGFHHGKLACFAAFSGTGKTTAMHLMIAGMVNAGEKVLIISNEDTIQDLQTRFLASIAHRFFHSSEITRDKFKRNDFTAKDREVVGKVIELFNEKFGKHIEFVGTSETNPKFFKRKIKEYHLKHGCTAFWIDTLKLAESDFKNERTDLALVANSRELANIAGRYNMIGVCSLQLAERHRGVLSASSAQIGTAKQVKEILQQLFIARPLYPTEELDKSKKKTYCYPFRLKTVDGKQVEEEVTLPMDKAYIVIAIDKNRDGTCTPNDGISYLYQFNGKYSSFDEVAMCRTAQTMLANTRA